MRHFAVNTENLGCSFFRYPSPCLPPVASGQNCTGCPSLPSCTAGDAQTRARRLQSAFPALPKVFADLPPRLVLAQVFCVEPAALSLTGFTPELLCISNRQRLKSPTKSVFSHSNSKTQEKNAEEPISLPCRPLLLFPWLS